MLICDLNNLRCEDTYQTFVTARLPYRSCEPQTPDLMRYDECSRKRKTIRERQRSVSLALEVCELKRDVLKLETYTKTSETGNGSSMRQIDEAKCTLRHLSCNKSENSMVDA